MARLTHCLGRCMNGGHSGPASIITNQTVADDATSPKMSISRNAIVSLLVAGVLAPTSGIAEGEDTTVRAMIHERLARNPAWVRARRDPPFSPTAPAGFVTDEHEKSRQRHAAETLLKQLNEARSSGSDFFKVPPGEYRFADNKGLTLSDWKNLTIDAGGACFWFERSGSQIAANPQGLNLRRCRNLTIRGLALDFDPPVYIQARIEEMTDDGGEIIARIDPAWPKTAVSAGQFSIYRADGAYVPQSLFKHKGAELFEADRLRVRIDPAVMKNNLDPKLLGYTAGRGGFQNGDWIALNFRRGHSIGVFDCEAVTLDKVSVYQSPGMGILEDVGAGGNTYRGVRMIRRPGTRRVHYGTADHFHSNRIRRGAQIIECEFAHSSDDFINLHGNWSYVWHQIDPTTLVIGAPDAPVAGGRLTVYDRTELRVEAEGGIVASRPLQDPALRTTIANSTVTQRRVAHRGANQLFVVKLDRPVTASPHQLADLHLGYCRGFRVENCYFHDSRSRGILLSGVTDGEVKNNIWHNGANGISVYEESWGYAEGPIPSNIRISDNLIMDCGGVVPGGGISVGLVPGGRQGLRSVHPIKGLNIDHNLLVNTDSLTLLYVDGGTVRNNILVEPQHYARFTSDYGPTRSLYGQRGYFPRTRPGAISIWSSRNIDVSGNRIFWSGRADRDHLIDIGEFTHDIRLNSNSLHALAPGSGLWQPF